ncbi:hypothetical protein AAHC03_026821 [Spirometra sp. Aus1]
MEESETVDYRSQLLRTAVTQLTDSPCQALTSDDLVSLAVDLLMGEIDIAHAHRRMDAHAKNVFPRRWRPGVNRRPKTDKPRNKRELRKAQYAEVQARLAKRPKLAAQFILSGDWRSASGAEPPRPAGTLDYWKAISETPSGQDQRPVPPVVKHWSLLNPVLSTDVTREIRKMRRSAAGIDGLDVSVIADWPPAAIAGYLNVISFPVPTYCGS